MSETGSIDLSNCRIMIVDDETFIQSLISRLLKKMGAVDIALAGNGQEALDALDAMEQEPDLMLVDMNMPVMGGVDLMHHLSKRGYAGQIVLASGAAPETLAVAEQMAKMRDVRVLGYITKPVSPASLNEILSKLE